MGIGYVRRRPAIAVAGLIMTTVLASCQPEGLTRQELVSRGDEICRQSSEQLNPLFKKLFPTGNETPSASRAAPQMRRAAEIVRREADSIKALRPADSLRQEFGAIQRALERSARLTEESAGLASRGDTEGYLEKLQEANTANQDARDLMVEFGFKDCAVG